MRSANQRVVVEAGEIVFPQAPFAQRLHAGGIEPGIELILIYIESWSEPHQSCRKQSAEKDCSRHRQTMPRDSPAEHGSHWRRWSEHSRLPRLGPAGFVFQARFGFGVMSLLHGVHAAVGLSEKLFDVESIVGAKRGTDAQRNNVAPAGMPAGLNGRLIQPVCLFRSSVRRESRSRDHKFV